MNICRYLEDLAIATGHMGQIKLIEGLIVASETLGGEVIFFSLSGTYKTLVKVLKKITVLYYITQFSCRENFEETWLWIHFCALLRLLCNKTRTDFVS